MKAILVILIFGIVFFAIFANTRKSEESTKNFNYVSNHFTLTEKKQSFFTKDPSSQIRNKIEFWEEPIKIPEPKH